jgi:hypothetical protein
MRWVQDRVSSLCWRHTQKKSRARLPKNDVGLPDVAHSATLPPNVTCAMRTLTRPSHIKRPFISGRSLYPQRRRGAQHPRRGGTDTASSNLHPPQTSARTTEGTLSLSNGLSRRHTPSSLQREATDRLI